jgi:hypothetical protein
MRPFTFSNGVTIPAGTLVSVPGGVIHKDGELYPNPEEFDGFRFVKLREHNVDASARHQALSTSVDHVTFGYGRHAWWVFGWFCFDPLQSLIFYLSALAASSRSTKSRLSLRTLL